MLLRSETTVTKRPASHARQSKTNRSSYNVPSRNDSSQTSFPAASTHRTDQDVANDELRQLLRFFN
jgi:hypothetical protein